MITTDTKTWIKEAARRLGFELCGIAPAELDQKQLEHYRGWLNSGSHGVMRYMERPQRQDLRAVLSSVRSVVSLGMVYHTPLPLSTDHADTTRGWIARYAWGDDYHQVVKEKMEQLLAELRAEVSEPFDARVYVDTGPILERAVAWQAGLGWFAKNTCILNEEIGSWFFLGEILTSLELPPDFPPPDRCGTCTRCIEACPTDAITEPYILDATRCISYYTIEVKGSIPEPMRAGIGRHIFGCDICQDVCPWNRAAPVTLREQFLPRPVERERNSNEAGDGSLFNPPLEALARLSEEQFNAMFRTSPLLRPKYRGFLRNVCVAMGNSGDEKFRPILQRLADHTDPIIKEHAEWALRQIRP